MKWEAPWGWEWGPGDREGAQSAPCWAGPPGMMLWSVRSHHRPVHIPFTSQELSVLTAGLPPGSRLAYPDGTLNTCPESSRGKFKAIASQPERLILLSSPLLLVHFLCLPKPTSACLSRKRGAFSGIPPFLFPETTN